MKNSILSSIIILTITFSLHAQCPESFHDFSALDIHGDTLHMSTFAGKKVLVVNTASYCGYTHQYGQLQTLYNTYGGDTHPYNFEIIGFPANNFANQEPYGEDSIMDVCDSYGVTFTMMSKVSVKDPGQHEIYQWLTQQIHNCVQNAPVTWNFQKFLINPDGSWHATFTPATSPLHSSIVNWITSMASVEDDIQTQSTPMDIFYAPVSKQIQINTLFTEPTHLKISLMNTSGQLISHLYCGHTDKNASLSFSTDILKHGIYFISAITDNTIFYRKIVVY